MDIGMRSDAISKGSLDNIDSKTQSTTTLSKESISSHGCVSQTDYNPFAERNVPHPTSTIGSFFHLLKSSLGSGLLAMPAAFKNAGLIPGCIGTLLVAMISTHCVDILVSTSREVCAVCREPLLSYTDTCEKAFIVGPRKLRQYSTAVRRFVDAAMAGVCVGGTSVYVIFIATSIKDICDYLAPSYLYSVQAYCGMLLLPLVLITQIRYLKFLVPFSLLANVCLLITFGITCYYTFTGDEQRPEVALVASVKNWPMFVSTAIFAMEGINVVMPVENEMAKPEHFLGCPGVLTATMSFVAILYGIVGIFGYLKYGNEVGGIITLNLPQDEALALTAKVLVAVAVFFTYCLQMYAPMDIIWSRLKARVGKQYHNIGQIVLRTVSVLISVILAAAVPDLEVLIGLVGAIFFSTLGLLIPLVVQTVHRWDRDLGRFNYILWKNVLLLVFYFVVLLSGCYSAINDIIDKFNKK